jgi:hypothetical protein
MGLLFEAAPPQTQADLLAAVLIQGPDWVESARSGWVGASPLLRSVVDLIEETDGTRSEFL